MIVQSTPYNVSACREEDLYAQLRSWAKSDGRAEPAPPNQWFVLPNGARRVPDAAWILKGRLATVVPQTPDKFWRIAPDLVVEIRSISDKLPVLRAKMEDWVESGVALAWLIDAERRAVDLKPWGAAVRTAWTTTPPFVFLAR
ncbi:MAG: Uma2 family endonuclease [Bryobacteraceae bacterium]|nr:Uma2 family endonuclease [Bryobacteraceae bacterium]